MDFFFTSLISPSLYIWKTYYIIPMHKMGKHLDSPTSFQPTFLTPCVSKFFERIILSYLLFFLKPNSILSSCQAGCRLGGLISIKCFIFYLLFSSHLFRMGSANPSRAFGRFLPLSAFLRLSTLFGIPLFFTNLFPLASLFTLLVQSFFSDNLDCVALQNLKSCFFRVRRGVPKRSVCLLFFCQ